MSGTLREPFLRASFSSAERYIVSKRLVKFLPIFIKRPPVSLFYLPLDLFPAGHFSEYVHSLGYCALSSSAQRFDAETLYSERGHDGSQADRRTESPEIPFTFSCKAGHESSRETVSGSGRIHYGLKPEGRR